jgi:hypothetical protein
MVFFSLYLDDYYLIYVIEFFLSLETFSFILLKDRFWQVFCMITREKQHTFGKIFNFNHEPYVSVLLKRSRIKDTI